VIALPSTYPVSELQEAEVVVQTLRQIRVDWSGGKLVLEVK
jgi:hypothetical protein